MKMIQLRRAYFTLLETLIAVALALVILSTLGFFYRQVDFINNKIEVLQKESFTRRYLENRLATMFPKVVPANTSDKDFFFFTSNEISLDILSHSPSLIFTYNNGFDLDKVFSNHVLARLFLDKDGRLCLAKWPSPKRWVPNVEPPMKLEVLMEGVKEISFQFFVAPDKKWRFQESMDEVEQLEEKAKPAPQTKQNQPNAPKDQPQTQQETKSQTQSQPQTLAEPTPTVKPSPEGSWIDYWNNDFQLLPALVRIRIKGPKEEDVYVFPLIESSRQIVYNQ